jgi:hypothetical protein
MVTRFAFKKQQEYEVVFSPNPQAREYGVRGEYIMERASCGEPQGLSVG